MMVLSAKLNALNSMFQVQKSKIEIMQREGWIASSEPYKAERQKFNECFDELEKPIKIVD
jgi:hypothetical protein